VRQIGAAIIGIVLCAAPAMAQHSGQSTGAPRKECLSDADRAIIATLKALTRPTNPEDPQPPFNPDYFVGTWTMEYDAPESALGPEGVQTGTLVVKHLDGCFYEGELAAKGPDGAAYTTTMRIMYDAAARYLTWVETDSRGYTLFKPGTIGADSGGYFTHYFETQGFKVGGQEIHLKGSTFLASPSNFRIRRSISTGGEPYMNLGEMWFRKKGTI